MTMMIMYHLTNKTSRTMGLTILPMAQPAIVGMIIQVMIMFLTQNFLQQQMSMTNPQDPMT